MTTKVEFDTTQYQFSHGRQPKGRGSWAFFFDKKMQGEAFWTPGNTSYSEAKRLVKEEVARRYGKDHEPGTVYVGP